MAHRVSFLLQVIALLADEANAIKTLNQFGATKFDDLEWGLNVPAAKKGFVRMALRRHKAMHGECTHMGRPCARCYCGCLQVTPKREVVHPKRSRRTPPTLSESFVLGMCEHLLTGSERVSIAGTGT